MAKTEKVRKCPLEIGAVYEWKTKWGRKGIFRITGVEDHYSGEPYVVADIIERTPLLEDLSPFIYKENANGTRAIFRRSYVYTDKRNGKWEKLANATA